MNNTTGGYIVNDPSKLDSIFRRWYFDKPILVHAEGNTLSTAINLADKYDRRLHVCHVSLEEEVIQIAKAKSKRGENKVTSEVTPHHLFISNLWSADGFKKMKPPLSEFKDMHVLWEGLLDGTIDIVATDHAPHSRDEKQSDSCPFGVTGLETTLPLLLMARRVGKISKEKIEEVTHTKALKIFNIPEQEDTYVEVINEPWIIRGEELKTKAASTPFEGSRFLDKVHRVVVRNKVVYEAGDLIARPGFGRVLP